MAEITERITNIDGIEKIIRTSTSFKVLSDPTRLKILCLLFDNKDGLCVNEISEYAVISQSAASHQLSKLEARGIVQSYRDGQMICYEIAINDLTKNLERVIKIFKY